jgi:hypothetical protein
MTAMIEEDVSKINSEARCLLLFMKDYSFIGALIVWYDVLYQINIISKKLQSVETNMSELIGLMEGCTKCFHQYRTDGFQNVKKITKEIAKQLEVDPVFVQHLSSRKKNVFSYEGTAASSYNPGEVFTSDIFLPLVDTVLCTIEDRFEQLKIHNDMLNFLCNIKNLPKREDLKHCMHLQENLKVEESSDKRFGTT